ncbi:WS/DGAT/MGAT family O-acyltransferase [Mobilicoccus pelagius]|uniref:Diacylglycerol O-acyltransferase n=1 Tax=Mobilicoccus pelagius NBRC 104925 TaxID=1089455 RepID=H5URX2_9MICO|nr:wax ester/triacylglycerol synthase family O-acyltransferase [Mobilicoccus pelagius]GAB48480.1 putative acyltransferase [Mobilicoccus pelagius NBRC 104925]
MLDRLSPLDASFLYLEDPSTPMHVGSVMILEHPTRRRAQALDHDELVALVSDRIGENSRYRQRVRELPGRLSGPVWVDDVDFDISYHVRRSALPSPGTEEQLAEFVARIQSRPLDREHPLWEVYVVEGLEGGRQALVTKTHEALVDGVTAVDLTHLLLDTEPLGRLPAPREWTPRPEPGDLHLLLAAASEAVRRPVAVVDRVRDGVVDGASDLAQRAIDGLGGIVAGLARTASSATPTTALATSRVRAPRRFRTVRSDLAEYRAIREAMGAARRPVDVTVTDVALTAVTGGLRMWLQARGEPVHSATTVRAMVPVSIAEGGTDADTDGPSVGSSEVVPCFVDLPVGEPSARLRLERIAYQTRHQARSSRALSAETLAGIAGFAPPTLHHLGARVAGAVSRRMFNLVVTNVPGPQRPLYVAGARMVATYPVMPLLGGQTVAIGLTSYDGEVFVGLNADRAAMPDLDVLAAGIPEALAELAATLVDVDPLGRGPRPGRTISNPIQET